MTQLAERHDLYAGPFEAFRGQPAFAAGGIRAAREAAFERFSARGFPTTRDEEWRFTSVAAIAATRFARTTGSADPAQVAPYLFDRPLAAQLVVVDGRVSAGLSSLSSLPVGLVIRGLDDGAVPAGPVDPGAAGSAFVDLNTAFFDELVSIEIAPGANVADPIHVLFLATGGGDQLVSPRLSIAVGERAQAAVIESYADLGSGTVFTNAVTQVAVAAGAVLDHVKLQRQADSTFHLATMFARLDRGGTFTSHSIALGGRLTRNDVVTVLEGEGAECTLNGLYVAGGESLVDNHTTIDHAQPHCPSHEVYKGILTGRARAVFNGKIVVRPEAQKTNAKQTNKALLLSADAQINTKPQLEIFADDVKCTHGAAIGQLDEDALFYLRARGLGLAEARNMLIHAFAGDVLAGVRVPEVRDAAMRIVDEKLSIA